MDKVNKKSKKSGLQLIIAILVTAALFLAELYAMINQPANIILIIGIAVLILIALFFAIDAILDCTEKRELADRELYDTIFRSEKASYTLLKKNLDEILQNRKESDKSGNSDQIEKIVNSQKAIAKMSMGITKESTESILASNREVFDKIAELKNLVGNDDNSEKQDRLFIELNNLEASVNDSIRGLSEKLSGFQEEIERLADHIARINADAIHEAVKTSNESKVAVEEAEEAVPEVTIEPEPESIPEIEPVAVHEPLKEENPNTKMDQDDIAALIASMMGGDEAPAPEPEPVVISELPKDENPNAKMNQDDIAALIASMTGGDEAPAPESIVEEKPPMPDLSDPNKVMTPEEIAALIANM